VRYILKSTGIIIGNDTARMGPNEVRARISLRHAVEMGEKAVLVVSKQTSSIASGRPRCDFSMPGGVAGERVRSYGPADTTYGTYRRGALVERTLM
jgi:hypothetical protein